MSYLQLYIIIIPAITTIFIACKYMYVYFTTSLDFKLLIMLILNCCSVLMTYNLLVKLTSVTLDMYDYSKI